MSQIENIAIVFIITFLFISFIVNKKINSFICEKTLEFEINKKIINIRVKKIAIGLLLGVTYFAIVIASSIMIIGNLKYYFEDTKKLDSLIIESNQKIEQEFDFYRKIINKEYDIEKCKNPYIFDGFTYVEGTWDTGFVIQDEKANQYVWVPCTNIKNNQGIEILKKSNFSNNAFINKFGCYEEKYEEFLISSLENGGFYISRFEICRDENNEPASQKNCEILTNITKKEAQKIANNMYTNINSELINGYAYDTALSWIINNEDIEFTEKVDSKIYSGTKSYKNIYDIVDNIYEITTEISYGEIIYRGIISDSKYMKNARFDNRLSGNVDYQSDVLGFRIVLYK